MLELTAKTVLSITSTVGRFNFQVLSCDKHENLRLSSDSEQEFLVRSALCAWQQALVFLISFVVALPQGSFGRKTFKPDLTLHHCTCNLPKAGKCVAVWWNRGWRFWVKNANRHKNQTAQQRPSHSDRFWTLLKEEWMNDYFKNIFIQGCLCVFMQPAFARFC